MKFTIFMLGGPCLLLALAAVTPNTPGQPDGFGLLAALWLWADIPLLGIYWLVRVARLAWRSGERA